MDDTTKPPHKEIARYSAPGGVRIYGIPIETFPEHFTNIYLVLAGEVKALIDLSSGWGESDAHLLDGIREIRERYGEKVSFENLDLILVTHGHIDHFGGLPHLRSRTRARVGVHELDVRQIAQFDETIMVVARDLRFFLESCGISERTQNNLMGMYTSSKDFFSSVSVDFHLDERAGPVEGIFRIHHTPGHCPGEVCIQVEDVLLSGDHLLSGITPHQSPEAIVRYTGLGHYLDSLRKIKAVPGLRLALGGHRSAMEDPYGRIEEIEAAHAERLANVFDICRAPSTIKEISSRLFDHLTGYEVLLGLEEAAAHVEYLFQRGRLAIDNLEDLEHLPKPTLRYRSR
jgi:glyoxylase-like metal-dependent hydrolase (beta-lactamase superfamily II)